MPPRFLARTKTPHRPADYPSMPREPLVVRSVASLSQALDTSTHVLPNAASNERVNLKYEPPSLAPIITPTAFSDGKKLGSNPHTYRSPSQMISTDMTQNVSLYRYFARPRRGYVASGDDRSLNVDGWVNAALLLPLHHDVQDPTCNYFADPRSIPCSIPFITSFTGRPP